MPLYRVGKTWYVDLATARGRLRRSTGTADRKQAQAYYQRLRTEAWRQERLGEAPSVTWGEALQKWVREKNPGLPDKYRVRALLIPSQERLPVSDSWIRKYSEGRSSGSFNRQLALLNQIHRLSGVEPASVERKSSPSGRTRFLSKLEWGRLSAALSKESPLLLSCAGFTLATGLRENNVLELEWSQVDLKRRTVLLHADQMKNRETLGIPLTDAAMAVLRARRGKNRRWVFAHPESGKPLVKASNRAWYTAVKKAKLVGFRWHDLRHTWASWAVMNGVSLRDLMALGGWKSYAMVTRYAHLAPEHLRAAADRVKPV